MNPWVILIIVVISVLFLYLVLSFFVVFYLFNKVFGVRGKDPDNPCYLIYDDYKDQLNRTPIRIGYYGEAIKGFIYSQKDQSEFKGFIILAHGFFGTHVQYLIDIAFLTRLGYQVLAFDQYGVGISEGKNQVSFANGVYVLENVIRAVEKQEMNHGLPIILYGHSWGAYSISGALKKHPEIQKAVMRSGFVSPTKVMLSFLKSYQKAVYYIIRPVFSLCCFFILGARNMITARRGLKNNKKTQCLFIHSLDDNFVPYSLSLANYAEKHPSKQWKTYVTKTGLHNNLITEQANQNYVDAVKEYQNIVAIQEENEKMRRKEEFISNLNRISMYPLRDDVVNQIVQFLEN